MIVADEALARARGALIEHIVASGVPTSLSMYGTPRYRDRGVEGMTLNEIKAALQSPVQTGRRVYAQHRRVLCTCGKITMAGLSDLNSITERPAQVTRPDLLDVSSTSCWLAFDHEGRPTAGCAPDDRTYLVIERATGERRETRVVELVAEPPPYAPPAATASATSEEVLQPSLFG